MLLCCSLLSWAQTTVTGIVFDETNLEVIGANVKEKGTTNGAITNLDGAFSFQVSDPQKAVLEISFIGYESQEVALNGRTNIKVVLKEMANELQEVTVVAYGVQKKETLTGAISAINNEALVRSPNANVANSLAGQITGLSSVASSGQPGAEDTKVFIRGLGSLNESASTPLILVDGVDRSFYQLDPNEIESVTVLKDASATAVFGVRGANGVIIVTTRRGTEGKTKISVNSSVGVQMPTRILKMADSYTYALLRNEIIKNDNPNATEADMVFDNYALCPLFDNGLSLLADTNMDFPLEKSLEDCLKTVEAKPFSRYFDEQLDAAEELYGIQLHFNFSTNDVKALIDSYRTAYSQEICDRCEALIRRQMRHYGYLVK